MILYDENNSKHKSIKTNKPSFYSNKNSWDNFVKTIDGKEIKFYFTVRNNRSWFYFNYAEHWYKVNMVSDEGVDLYDKENLFVKKKVDCSH